MSYIIEIDFDGFNVSDVADLLQAYNDSHITIDGLKVVLNKHSGWLFLCDREYNEFMVNPETDNLEQYMHCNNCGHQEFESSLEPTKTYDERLDECSCTDEETDLNQWDSDDCECGAFDGYMLDDEDYTCENPEERPKMCSNCDTGRLFPVW